MQATDFSAAPARVCRLRSGHQIPAVLLYLPHLANVVCCWASTIIVNAARAYGPFLAEADQFWLPILVGPDQFSPRTKTFVPARQTRRYARNTRWNIRFLSGTPIYIYIYIYLPLCSTIAYRLVANQGMLSTVLLLYKLQTGHATVLNTTAPEENASAASDSYT